MGVARRVIFPALRIGIWAVIAFALVVLAFNPGGETDGSHADPAEPGANFTDPIITPTRGDVTNTVRLSASIVPDATHEVPSTSAGTVHHLWVGPGDVVEAGAPLVVLKQLLGEGTDENRYTTSTVWANQSGTVAIDLDYGQEVDVGDVVAKITSGTHVVEADIEPLQMYGLLDPPGTAEVTILEGPPTFTCKSFTISVVDGEDGAAIKGRCFVPSDVVVFPGLSATVEIITDTHTDALLLPITAVEGTVDEGLVWFRDEQGELTSIEVGLGLNDGEFIEITSGLDESQEVLEYAPSQSPEDFGPDYGWEEDFGDEDWVDEEFDG